MGQLYRVRQSIIQKAGWAVVPEPKQKKVKQVNEEGEDWAVVPEPSLPSFFFLQQRDKIHLFFSSFSCTMGCWVIFHLRRYLRELGAFDLDKEQPTPKRVLESIRDLSQRVYPSLPTTVADLLRPPLKPDVLPQQPLRPFVYPQCILKLPSPRLKPLSIAHMLLLTQPLRSCPPKTHDYHFSG